MTDNTTHFGFQSVHCDEKIHKVNAVFASVAARYDLMNDLMSFGIHRIWKQLTVALSHVRPGHCVLDLAGGSGDLTRLLYDKVSSSGQIVLADININMLSVGRNRLLDMGIVAPVHFVLADAEHLPFAEHSFHCIIMAFGLRNVTQQMHALKSMYHVCKPGGKVMILEFSKLTIEWLKPLYDWYSFQILPRLGELVAQDAASYRYLAESIRMHPAQDTLQSMLTEAGFEDCYYYNFSGGIVALHVGYKY